jgi:hypothetical protein
MIKKNTIEKIPVFFHIPKNAGTYVYNKAFHVIRLLNTKDLTTYNLAVKREGKTVYRIVCSAKKELNDKYKDAGCWIDKSVDYEDLDFNDLTVYFIVVCDLSFGIYKEDIYKKLDKNTKFYEFLVLRDPYERVLSLFSYLKSSQSSHESKHGIFGDMTFVEYLNSPYLEGSWLIRTLLHIPNKIPITSNDFEKTCEILDGFLIDDITGVDKLISKVLYTCLNVKDCSLPQRLQNVIKPFSNKTKEKITYDFNCLSEETKDNFNNQTKWDQLLFNKYKKI